VDDETFADPSRDSADANGEERQDETDERYPNGGAVFGEVGQAHAVILPGHAFVDSGPL
jgi:hypothetical protein